MKELQSLLKTYTDRGGQGMALATIVKTVGSSYRRAGARMLILPDGTTVGSISGGCLEQDVVAHAGKCRAAGEPVLLTYDTTSEEDTIIGLGLGCKGIIEILLEPTGGCNRPFHVDRVLTLLAGAHEERRHVVVATVFRIEGALKGRLGDRFTLNHSGVVFSDLREPDLRAKVEADALESLRSGRSQTVRYELSGGAAEIFIQVTHAPAALVIFGAGHDAMPLSRLADELGFHVTVVDRRPAYATRERFPNAANVLLLSPETIDEADLNERTAVVVMFHHYETDLAYFRTLIRRPLRYLGLMGPRKRAERMLTELAQSGFEIKDEFLRKLHNPVGLDIGAETPEEIALAVLAEIQAVFSNHTGGLLREKKGLIHAPRPAAPSDVIAA